MLLSQWLLLLLLLCPRRRRRRSLRVVRVPQFLLGRPRRWRGLRSRRRGTHHLRRWRTLLLLRRRWALAVLLWRQRSVPMLLRWWSLAMLRWWRSLLWRIIIPGRWRTRWWRAVCDGRADVVTTQRDAHHHKKPVDLLGQRSRWRHTQRLVGQLDGGGERSARIHLHLPFNALDFGRERRRHLERRPPSARLRTWVASAIVKLLCPLPSRLQSTFLSSTHTAAPSATAAGSVDPAGWLAAAAGSGQRGGCPMAV